MRIFFSDKIDCDAATGVEMPNTEVRFLAENDSETNCRIHAKCSVRVTQIFLNISKQSINCAFNKFGKVVQIVMSTRNTWQSAIVTFDNVEAAQQFKDIWSVYILRDMVTVTPLTANYEESYVRSAYCLRLTGLPPNTNARDLDEIGKTIKAKTWTIPRSKFNYNYLRYAFFNFATEQDCITAANTPMGLGTTKLAWAKHDAQLCGRCASVNHLSKDCPERRPAVNQEFAKLYAKFKPAQFRSFKANNNAKDENSGKRRQYENRSPTSKYTGTGSEVKEGRSYASVTNPNTDTNKNIENGTKKGGSMHERTENFDAAGAHRTLLKHLSEIKTQMKNMNVVLEQQDNRIKVIEELNGIKTTTFSKPQVDSGMEIDMENNGTKMVTINASSSKTTHNANQEVATIHNINNLTKNLQAENKSLKETLATIASKYNELIDVLGSASSTKIDKIDETFINTLTQFSPNTSNNE